MLHLPLLEEIRLPATPSFPERFQFRRRFRKQKTPRPHVIPNMITLLALCSGLSGVRFALLERWDLAILAILLACFFDFMDGRVARALGGGSRFGAELDSLSDLVSFGISPALIMYFRTLSSWNEQGWMIALFFSVCMALRLARFNTQDIEGVKSPDWTHGFFTGIPAPAAGLLGLSPLIWEIAFPNLGILRHPAVTACTMIITSCLMISRVPTFSLKKLKIPSHLLLPSLALLFSFLAWLYLFPWIMLTILGVIYMALIPVSMWYYHLHRSKNS